MAWVSLNGSWSPINVTCTGKPTCSKLSVKGVSSHKGHSLKPLTKLGVYFLQIQTLRKKVVVFFPQTIHNITLFKVTWELEPLFCMRVTRDCVSTSFDWWKPSEVILHERVYTMSSYQSKKKKDTTCKRSRKHQTLTVSVCWSDPFPRLKRAGTHSQPAELQGSWLLVRRLCLVMCWLGQC